MPPTREQSLPAPRHARHHVLDLGPLAPSGAADAHGEDRYATALRILYRRRWTAAGVCSGALLVGLLYLLTTPPAYEARVRVLIQPDNPNVVSYKDVMDQDRSAVDYYQTQYTILQSRTLARLTIDKLHLWDYPEFAGTADGHWLRIRAWFGHAGDRPPTTRRPPGDAAAETAQQGLAITRMLQQLTIEPVKNSRLVDVRFQAGDPAVAARVANALAVTYIEQNLNIRVQAAKEASRWLEERVTEQQQKVELNELALQRYREQNDATSLEDKQNTVLQRLADLNAAATRARTNLIEKQALYEQSVALKQAKAPLDTFPPILTNAAINTLKQQLAELQRQQAQLADRLGERHPDMVKVQSAIQAATTKLNVELDKALQVVRNDYLVAQAQERSLSASLDLQKQQALDLDRKAINYGTLQRNAATDRGVFETLLQRAKETGLATELKAGNVRILDEAELPRKPIWPDTTRGVPVVLVASLCLALAAAFAAEGLDRRIKSPDEIRTRLGAPLIGLVPMIHAKGAYPSIESGAPANFIEAFGDLRSAVLLTGGPHPARHIVVASARPREGKTLVASNLAIALAHSGKRVLLADVDLRRPRLHTVFDVPLEPGLADSLAGRLPVEATIQATSVAGLSVLPAGVPDGNPGALLASTAFKAFVDSLGDNFDLVVLDSPPVLAVGDAAVAAAAASAVVFVVDAQSTPRQAAVAALERLDTIGVDILGIVLNQVNLDGHPHYYQPYYSSEYESYYAIGAADALPGSGRSRAHIDSH